MCHWQVYISKVYLASVSVVGGADSMNSRTHREPLTVHAVAFAYRVVGWFVCLHYERILLFIVIALLWRFHTRRFLYRMCVHIRKSESN